MKGYLLKQRYYPCGTKTGKPRRRFVQLDEVHLTLNFKTSENEVKVHKSVPLEEIESVIKQDDDISSKENLFGFIMTMRELATSEPPGSHFLFQAETVESRDLWIRSLKRKVNGNNNGLELVPTRGTLIHQKYDTVIRSPQEVLGSGMSGDVRLIRRREDGKEFAMKTVLLAKVSPAKIVNLRREIDILQSLDHPHIAKLYETFFEPKMYCKMVMELCRGGELFKRLKNKGYLSEHYTRKLVIKMLRALNYLHTNNIVHRDLKLENWLFRNEQKECNCADGLCSLCEDDDIVLIDFGLSIKYTTDNELLTNKVGTCYYVAPEVLEGKYKGSECDLWSLGVIIFMLLSGEAPFHAETDDDIAGMIINSSAPIDEINNSENAMWQSISEEGRDFLTKLMTKDPSQRISAPDALQHKWIINEIDENKNRSGSFALTDASVLERLKNFTKYKELKRLAMEVIAFSLDHKEIKDLTEMFEEMDSDNDGYIELKDMLRVLKKNPKLDEKDITEIFSALDEEHNGKVHCNEFVASCMEEKYHCEETFLREAFSKMDVNGKGKITIEDLKHLLGKCASERRVKEIWAQSGLAAKKESDEISFHDFMEFMRTDGESDVVQYKRASLAVLHLKAAASPKKRTTNKLKTTKSTLSHLTKKSTHGSELPKHSFRRLNMFNFNKRGKLPSNSKGTPSWMGYRLKKSTTISAISHADTESVSANDTDLEDVSVHHDKE